LLVQAGVYDSHAAPIWFMIAAVSTWPVVRPAVYCVAI